MSQPSELFLSHPSKEVGKMTRRCEVGDYDYQLAVMDDDGFGCAITTSPAEREQAEWPRTRCLKDGAAMSYLFRAAGWVWQCEADSRHVVAS